MSTSSDFMRDALAAFDSPDGRAAFVALLRAHDGQRVRVNAAELVRAERQAEAHRMLGIDRDRAAIVRRLVHLFGVSAQTARRDVAAALAARRPDLTRA